VVFVTFENGFIRFEAPIATPDFRGDKSVAGVDKNHSGRDKNHSGFVLRVLCVSLFGCMGRPSKAQGRPNGREDWGAEIRDRAVDSADLRHTPDTN
jgi:hypothetical protein